MFDGVGTGSGASYGGYQNINFSCLLTIIIDFNFKDKQKLSYKASQSVRNQMSFFYVFNNF